MVYLSMAAAIGLFLLARWLRKRPLWLEERRAAQIANGQIAEESYYPTQKGVVLALYFFAACCLTLSFTLDKTQSTSDLVAIINDPGTPQQDVDNAKQILLHRHFNTLGGVPIKLSQEIRQTLRDPDSFAPNKTQYINRGNHIAVTVEYRAQNTFGTLTREYIEAQIGWDGEVISLSESRPL